MTISVNQPDWDFIATSPELMLSSLTHMGLIEITGEQGPSHHRYYLPWHKRVEMGCSLRP